MFRRYKTFRRYQTIASILIRHGFHEFVAKSNLSRYLVFSRGKALREPEISSEPPSRQTTWLKIRMIVEELGPAFVKLGQFVSDRPDLLPADLCQELKNLLDSVAPFDTKEAIQLIERELQSPIEEIFKEFSEKPISSASIGQVHRAVLHDGAVVAVKVRRPGIRKTIEADLDIMINLAGLLEKYLPGTRTLNPRGIVEEFREAILNELDYTNEANNIQRFKEYFEGDKRIYISNVYRQYCTRNILVMEFIDGVKLKDLSPAGRSEEDIRQICDRMTDLVLKQIFELGFFHADPHMANILVMDKNVICFIDLGLMGTLLPKHKELLGNLIIALVKHDSRKITQLVTRLSPHAEIPSREMLEYDVLKMMEKYSYLPLKNINVGSFLNELIKLAIKYRVTPPPDLVMLMKSLLSVEGAARKFCPDFNMVEHVEPYVKKLAYEAMSPKKIVKDVLDSISEYAQLVYDLPSEIRELLTQFKNKNFKIQFEHKGLEPMLKKHDQISNRIAFSIVTAALIIGSALIMHANIAPRLYGISLIGVVIFIFSAVMGAVLLISILRHGRM